MVITLGTNYVFPCGCVAGTGAVDFMAKEIPFLSKFSLPVYPF